MLSFGGLLSEIISGGSPTLNRSDPGLVKILGGFVFPVGLVMCVPNIPQSLVSSCIVMSDEWDRIVLQGQELLTSNMMVSASEITPLLLGLTVCRPCAFPQVFPMAIIKGAVPIWSLPVNWIIGKNLAPFHAQRDLASSRSTPHRSHVRKSRGQPFLWRYSCQMCVQTCLSVVATARAKRSFLLR
jgi:hypothetical protein